MNELYDILRSVEMRVRISAVLAILIVVLAATYLNSLDGGAGQDSSFGIGQAKVPGLQATEAKVERVGSEDLGPDSVAAASPVSIDLARSLRTGSDVESGMYSGEVRLVGTEGEWILAGDGFFSFLGQQVASIVSGGHFAGSYSLLPGAEDLPKGELRLNGEEQKIREIAINYREGTVLVYIESKERRVLSLLARDSITGLGLDQLQVVRAHEPVQCYIGKGQLLVRNGSSPFQLPITRPTSGLLPEDLWVWRKGYAWTRVSSGAISGDMIELNLERGYDLVLVGSRSSGPREVLVTVSRADDSQYDFSFQTQVPSEGRTEFYGLPLVETGVELAAFSSNGVSKSVAVQKFFPLAGEQILIPFDCGSSFEDASSSIVIDLRIGNGWGEGQPEANLFRGTTAIPLVSVQVTGGWIQTAEPVAEGHYIYTLDYPEFTLPIVVDAGGVHESVMIPDPIHISISLDSEDTLDYKNALLYWISESADTDIVLKGAERVDSGQDTVALKVLSGPLHLYLRGLQLSLSPRVLTITSGRQLYEVTLTENVEAKVHFLSQGVPVVGRELALVMSLLHVEGPGYRVKSGGANDRLVMSERGEYKFEVDENEFFFELKGMSFLFGAGHNEDLHIELLRK